MLVIDDMSKTQHHERKCDAALVWARKPKPSKSVLYSINSTDHGDFPKPKQHHVFFWVLYISSESPFTANQLLHI